MVNVPFHNGDNQFYLENLYLPLAVFVAVPLIFDVLPGLTSERGLFVALVLLTILQLSHIYRSHRPWTDRLHWEQDYLRPNSRTSSSKIPADRTTSPHG
jgi:hypothetical protein